MDWRYEYFGILIRQNYPKLTYFNNLSYFSQVNVILHFLSRDNVFTLFVRKKCPGTTCWDKKVSRHTCPGTFDRTFFRDTKCPRTRTSGRPKPKCYFINCTRMIRMNKIIYHLISTTHILGWCNFLCTFITHIQNIVNCD
jgi:hypothetical protein